MAYDDDNIFAKILRGEIPCEQVHESAHSLAFRDIAPQAPTHILVIPKGKYVDATDFADNASDAEIADLMRVAAKVARDAGVDAPGYRLLANAQADAGQEVPHFHLHVLGGRPLGPMLARRDG